MKKNDVNEIINQIRLNNNFSSIEIFHPDMDLRNDLGLSSFDLAELTVRIEDIFGIDIFSNGLITKLGEIYLMLDEQY
jgi:acyl carrier protein